MLEDDNCCDYEMNLGPLPMSVAFPFIFLICLELTFLLRAVALTLWPSWIKKYQNNGITSEYLEHSQVRSKFMACLCCCLKWNVKLILKVINILVLLNPFFGCVIAWMLLYQSDKSESF